MFDGSDGYVSGMQDVFNNNAKKIQTGQVGTSQRAIMSGLRNVGNTIKNWYSQFLNNNSTSFSDNTNTTGGGSSSSGGHSSSTGNSVSNTNSAKNVNSVNSDVISTSVPSGSNGVSFDIGDFMKAAQNMQAANSAAMAAAAERQYQFNAEEALKNREWQEMMSNTAHQREIADLAAAGLNPVLSVTGGNGAAVTSGATASGALANVDTEASKSFQNFMIALLNSATDIVTAKEAAQAGVTSAGIHAAAQRYGAELSSSATRFAAGASSGANLIGKIIDIIT